MKKVSLQQLKGSFDATAAGRVLSGDDAGMPIEVLDAMRVGLETCGDRKIDVLTLADFEMFHQVSQ